MSPGSSKAASFGSMKDLERGSVLGKGDELIKRMLPPFLRPHATALVDKPQPGDVAEEAEGSAHATFVGEIRRERSVGDHGLLDLETDKRPGSDADEDRIGLSKRDGGHCGTGVVRRHRHNLRVPQSGLLRHVGAEGGQPGARPDHVR